MNEDHVDIVNQLFNRISEQWMQSVGLDKYEVIFVYFLSELLCLSTHQEFGVVILHWDLLLSYNWNVCVWSLSIFLCSHIKLFCLSALQYWLGYICKCSEARCANSRATVFSHGRNNHAPFPQYASNPSLVPRPIATAPTLSKVFKWCIFHITSSIWL